MTIDLAAIRTAWDALGDPTAMASVARPRARRYHSRFVRTLSSEPPTQVADEDWDVLVLLDGCRTDTFADLNTIDGELETRVSLGSQSWEFLRANFAGRSLHDTVYVSANPFTTRLDDGTFHARVSLLDEWDETHQTVLPEAVTDAALVAADRFPNKRLVVHYMQPHYPFISQRGREMDVRGYNRDQRNRETEGPSVWKILREGLDGYENVTLQAVRAAYRENLEVVLPHVARIVSKVPGRTVVSADHGNLLGERLYPVPIREYGHPRGLFSPPLVRVPWLVAEADRRRRTTSDSPVGRDGTRPSDETVLRRLGALGYRD